MWETGQFKVGQARKKGKKRGCSKLCILLQPRTGYNTITRLDRENAYALARIIDSSGRVRVYIETNGLDTTDNYITKPVRGFVLASMVFLNDHCIIIAASLYKKRNYSM